MVKYDELIQRLSKALINAGKTEYTPQHIEKKIQEIMQAEGIIRKPSALAIFKSLPDVRRALSFKDMQEVTFDVLAVRESQTMDEKATPYQEISIAINRNGKPEFRKAMMFERKIDIESDVAYRAKVSIQEDNRCDFPDNVVLNKLDKILFTPSKLMQYSEPAEDIKFNQVGVWHGQVGNISTRGGGTILEVSTLGSFQPVSMWFSDTSDISGIVAGDDVVFGGKQAKKWFYPSFIKVVVEDGRTQDSDSVLR